MTSKGLNSSVIALALASAFGAGYWSTSVPLLKPAHAAAPGAVASPSAPGITLPDFTTLVAEQGDAVVHIRVSHGAAESRTPRFQGDKDSEEFFRRFPMPPSAEQFGKGVPAEGVGSGFIVSSDGYVLTNAHVVADASEVLVGLTDKREFKAKVVGTDRRTDVALLKIDATNLPAVKIGDADKARVGEWVAAIGTPFGFDNTVTAGIVSAKTRSLPDSSYVPFIQTDVALNPGNSGGPLFNLKGEVIGINSQIYSRTGGYMGLSFAIPIDVAMDVKEQLQKSGKVTRGRIGVTVQDINADLAKSFGLPKAQGALVSSVENAGPAAKAGLKPGDVILKVNQKDIGTSAEVARAIAKMTPGKDTTLAVWRDGASREVKVVLAELPSDAVASQDREAAPPLKLGVAVRALTPQEQGRVGQPGVLVEQAEGPAARAGIREGDIILGVNSQPVSSPEELKRLVEKSTKDLALLVERNGARIFLPIDIS